MKQSALPPEMLFQVGASQLTRVINLVGHLSVSTVHSKDLQPAHCLLKSHRSCRLTIDHFQAYINLFANCLLWGKCHQAESFSFNTWVLLLLENTISRKYAGFRMYIVHLNLRAVAKWNTHSVHKFTCPPTLNML